MSKEFSVEQLQALMKSVSENRIGELSFESEGVKVKIKNWMMAPLCGAAEQPSPVPAPAMQSVTPTPAPMAAELAPAPAGRYITSPIVGTFYASASPDKEPFVQVGQRISKGDIVFIVESMKVMNEVPADLEGTVAEILTQSGEPVEYGQNILRLE